MMYLSRMFAFAIFSVYTLSMCVFAVRLCTLLRIGDCSLLQAAHQRVLKVMNEPLLQWSVGEREKRSHRISSATISQMA